MNRTVAAVFGALVVLAGLLPSAQAQSPAQVQSWRAAGTFYGKVGVGISEYAGNLSPSARPYGLGHFGEGRGFPYVARLEIGYHASPALAVGVGVGTGNYPFADRAASLEGAQRTTLQLLARYTYRSEAWRGAPYVDVGRVMTFGGFRSGHGVSVGFGIDYALTRRVALNVESRVNSLWSDSAVDGRGLEGLDHLSQLLGVGVKVNLNSPREPSGPELSPPVAPRILTVAGSTQVEVGQEVTYTARVSEKATRPLRRAWTVGTVPAGSTRTITHRFAHPGTHTVVFEARNEAGTARDSVQVEVAPQEVPKPAAPAITEMSVSPRTPPKTGQTIQFRGAAEGGKGLTYRWDFGDGDSGTGPSPTHAYEKAGTYAVQLEVTNAAGTDTRRLYIPVRQGRVGSIEQAIIRNGRGVLEDVRFGLDSATIEPGGEKTLRTVLEVLQDRMPKSSFVIEGHTDSTGSDSYNKRLSERRARSVMEWLLARGIDPDRLTPRGLGEAEPIASNATPEGRRKNRRVEIVVASPVLPFTIHIGAFSEQADARQLASKVRDEEREPVFVRPKQRGEQTVYQVWVGQYESNAAAARHVDSLRSYTGSAVVTRTEPSP